MLKVSGILRLESLTKGNILRQGDLTLLKYRLFDADGDKLDISGKSATVRLMKDSFTFIAYEKEGLTVASDDTISFNVNKILPAGLYHLEVIVDDKYIFPSRDDEGGFNVDKSTLGADINIIEATGVEAVARKATSMMKQDEEFIDDMTENVISDSKVQSFAQGIDAKVTNALSLSESADTLSKSVQEQFNQVVIDGDSSVESAQARVTADGVTKATLKERLDDEHTEFAEQLAHIGYKLPEISVLEYGADPTGVKDSSQAFRDTIIASLKHGGYAKHNRNPTIIIPTGDYNIESDKVFSDFIFNDHGLPNVTHIGIIFRGSGKGATTLNLITNGSEKWFYDNGVGQNKFAKLWFEHLSFSTDDRRFGNGFKQWSAGQETQFRFFDCAFYLGKVFQAEGTGNADLNRFLMCSINALDYVFTLNNHQSVVNEFVSTDVFMAKGFVDVLGEGGGSFKSYGGSFEMHNNSANPIENHYFIKVNVTDPARMGLGNCDFNFNDLKMEIHGDNKKLVLATEGELPLNINFINANLGTVTGVEREAVDIVSGKKVSFLNSILNERFLFKVGSTGLSTSPTPAELYFENTVVGNSAGKKIWERIVTRGDNYRVIANRCTAKGGGVGHAVIAQDFDLGWNRTTSNTVSAQKKIINIKPHRFPFPTNDGAYTTIFSLPPNAFITKIYVDKPSYGTNTDSYQLHIGSKDKSTIILSSPEVKFNEPIKIEQDNIGRVNFSEFRMWATGTSNSVQSYSGTVYIEYI